MADEQGDQSQTDESASKPAAPGYTSVVYVHGIGSQRRYEETSRLVDGIDHYLGQEYRRGNVIGRLKDVDVRVEPFRGDPGAEIIAFIRARLEEKDADEPGGRRITTARFYEIYWAPIMADVKSPFAVVRWILRQAFRPIATLTSPWRERQRLRRAVIASMAQRAPLAARDDCVKLMQAYNRFEGLPAQRAYPAGTFDDFLAFVADESERKSASVAQRQALARRWRRAYRLEELRTAFALASIALALLLLCGAVLAGVLVVLRSLLGWSALSRAVTALDLPLHADFATAATIALALAGLLGIGRFLTDYLGDVEAWSTYEETDAKNIAREKVLDEAIATIRHVLADPRCDRVAIVAHSLGTSIAHDALLAITRRNRATNPADPIAGPTELAKIEHFVTMGSPIDKIEYFFESYVSASHRYKRVIEALRGDIGTPPFSRNGKPYIHWINYWDAGDPISGALDSPASGNVFRQHVDNVRVHSVGFPRPGAAHSGYFGHRTVIGQIVDVVFHRAGSFVALKPGDDDTPPPYDSVYLGPGEPGDIRPGVTIAALVPWLALAALVAWVVGVPVIAWVCGGAAAVGAAVLVGAAAVSRVQGHRHSL